MLGLLLSLVCLASLSGASFVVLVQEKEPVLLDSSDYSTLTNFDVVVVVRSEEEDESNELASLRDSLGEKFENNIKRIDNDADLNELTDEVQHGIYLLNSTEKSFSDSKWPTEPLLLNFKNILESSGKQFAILFQADSTNKIKRRSLLSTPSPPPTLPREVFIRAIGSASCNHEVALLYAEKLRLDYDNTTYQSKPITGENTVHETELDCDSPDRTLTIPSSLFEQPPSPFSIILHASNSTTGYWAVERFELKFDNGSSTLTLVPSNPFPSESYTDSISGIPVGYSFHCGQNIIYKANNSNTDKSNFTLTGVQIRMFGNGSGDGMKFDDNVNDCVGYFSTALWSGIIVVALFLFILVVSFYFMFGMQTMDRFDNPKGKTIIVPTS